jgi:hypothetical protein
MRKDLCQVVVFCVLQLFCFSVSSLMPALEFN